VESSCKLDNEPSGSIKCWETTEWLHKLWPASRAVLGSTELVSYIATNNLNWECLIVNCFLLLLAY
jgi:hypothetical protein